MPTGGETAKIEVSGNTLRVCGEFGTDEGEAFRKAARGLIETEHEELVIDLSGVSYVRSAHVADIVAVMVQAGQHGRSVSVRATPKVAQLLSMAGLDDLGSVEAVE